MRERGITLLLALAALVVFYGLWLRPAPTLDPNADAARPTSAERRGNGYAGLFEWLQRTGTVPDDDMLRTFNMGIGLIVVCETGSVDAVIRDLAGAGEPGAVLVGHVTPGQRTVRYVAG